jgi:hypothetical protein
MTSKTPATTARDPCKYPGCGQPAPRRPGQATRQSPETYSRLALADAQQRYDDVIGDFPV